MAGSNQRVVSAIFFITICILTFFLGYSFGLRPPTTEKQVQVSTLLPNKFVENSLTKIQIRPILGVVDASGRPKEVGKMYFVINKDEQTELLFRLENLPSQIEGNQKKQPLPQELSIHLARRSVNGSDFDYEFAGTMGLVRKQGQNNTQNSGQNSILDGDFSTILEYNFLVAKKKSIIAETASNSSNSSSSNSNPNSNSNSNSSSKPSSNLPDFVENTKVPERIEIFANNKDDPATANIFTDSSPTLPINIRGDQGLGIAPRPAPYFWVNLG